MLIFYLLVEAFLGFMNKNNCFPMLIILWATCTTHHLQDIGNWEINISFCFSVIIFSSLRHYMTSQHQQLTLLKLKISETFQSSHQTRRMHLQTKFNIFLIEKENYYDKREKNTDAENKSSSPKNYKHQNTTYKVETTYFNLRKKISLIFSFSISDWHIKTPPGPFAK